MNMALNGHGVSDSLMLLKCVSLCLFLHLSSHMGYSDLKFVHLHDVESYQNMGRYNLYTPPLY